jgi:hypothetical protein
MHRELRRSDPPKRRSKGKVRSVWALQRSSISSISRTYATGFVSVLALTSGASKYGDMTILYLGLGRLPALGVRTRLAWCGLPFPRLLKILPARRSPRKNLRRSPSSDARPVIFFQREPVVEHGHEAACSMRGQTNEITTP